MERSLLTTTATAPSSATTTSPSSTTKTAPSSNSRNIKSLQELSAAEAIRLLHEDKNAVKTFNDLDDDRRQVLFGHIWQEHLRLVDVEREYKASQQRTPAADGYICFNNSLGLTMSTKTADDDRKGADSAENPQANGDENEDEDEVDDEDDDEDGGQVYTKTYALSHYFRSKWRYRTLEGVRDYESSYLDEREVWDTCRLNRTADPKKPIEFCCFWDKGHFHLRDNAGFKLPNFISSQLFLYRIVAVFGMPPPRIDPEGMRCWNLQLTFCEDRHSTFLLGDFLGGANVSFCGTPEVGHDALELLNFLVSNDVPHKYRPFLAGTIATEDVHQEAYLEID